MSRRGRGRGGGGGGGEEKQKGREERANNPQAIVQGADQVTEEEKMKSSTYSAHAPTKQSLNTPTSYLIKFAHFEKENNVHVVRFDFPILFLSRSHFSILLLWNVQSARVKIRVI
jgi:hypothetical protein